MLRQELSGGDQVAFPLLPSHGHTQLPPSPGPREEMYGETIHSPQRQEGSPEDRCSEEAWVFRTLFPAGIEFAGPRPLPSTCGSARCPCRTFHALKIPIVSLPLSLSAWVVFLTNGNLCLFTQQICIDYLLSARHRHGMEDRGAPCSQGTYCPMKIEKQSSDFGW